MLAIELEHLIPDLVKYLAPKERGKGLILTFDVRLHEYKKDVKRRAVLRFLFHWNVAGYDVFFRRDEEDWKHTSSHDSCWKTDGLRDINPVYFSLAQEIIEEIGDENLAPCDLGQMVWFGDISRDGIKIVDVEVKRDPDDQHNYRKVVKVL